MQEQSQHIWSKMTEEYSLKKEKKTKLFLNPFLIASILLLAASILFYFFIVQKPKVELKQVDLNLVSQEKPLADSFEIIVSEGNVDNRIQFQTKLIDGKQYQQIFAALSKEMNWPRAFEFERLFLIKQNNTAVVNFSLDKAALADISIAQERNILNSIDKTLKINGIADYRILINGQESEVFLKNLSLKVGLN